MIYYLDLLIESFQNGKEFEGLFINEETDKIIVKFQTRHLLKAFNLLSKDYAIDHPFKTAQSLNANIRNSIELLRFNWSYHSNNKKISGFRIHTLVKDAFNF